MLIRKNNSVPDRGQSHLTAMIDVVFLLLVFFVMTFRVVVSEGDFCVRAPAAKSGSETVDMTFEVPIQIELKAGPAGQLTGISVDGVAVGGVEELANALRGRLQLQDDSIADHAAIIRCDQALRYEHTIQVLAIVHGSHAEPLIENIRLERIEA
jgi:biopolymer transport protein ExbD